MKKKAAITTVLQTAAQLNNPLSIRFEHGVPSVHISLDSFKSIVVEKGAEKIEITAPEIWEALKP